MKRWEGDSQGSNYEMGQIPLHCPSAWLSSLAGSMLCPCAPSGSWACPLCRSSSFSGSSLYLPIPDRNYRAFGNLGASDDPKRWPGPSFISKVILNNINTTGENNSSNTDEQDFLSLIKRIFRKFGHCYWFVSSGESKMNVAAVQTQLQGNRFDASRRPASPSLLCTHSGSA